MPEADRFGVQTSYQDFTGAWRRVPRSTVRAVQALIGEPERFEAPVVLRGGTFKRLTGLGPGELTLEDGTVVSAGEASDQLPLGYHRFTNSCGSTRSVIVAPPRCHLTQGRRAWGWAMQLYAVRSDASWGMGDLADLSILASWAAGQGAGFLLLNPLGAPTPGSHQEPSPYFPSTRRFRNPLYLAVEQVPGAHQVDAVAAAAEAGRALNDRPLVERDAIWQVKRAALEAVWEAAPPGAEFGRWRARQPASAELFATWSALAERYGPEWRRWPAPLRRPGPQAERAATELGDRREFHLWLQWLAETQLAQTTERLAVFQDLPIGIDPSGFDAWEWQDLLCLDATIGAPPDEFNTSGQDWGLPPFVPWRMAARGYRPFVETIQASLARGGGLRIDHVMGLFRLWWIPAGHDPRAGAYVRYPADDLLAILALESQRAAAPVVGEDLGTVEDAARAALAENDILSYRLLWFEEAAPASWPAKALAAVTTHDLPTVAGLWGGADLTAQREAGLEPSAGSTDAIRDRLARDAALGPGASTEEAVVGAHQLLARAPSVLLTATLEDAVASTQRPNMPGAGATRPNWSIPLPVDLGGLCSHPLAARVAAELDRAVRSAGGCPTGPRDEREEPW